MDRKEPFFCVCVCVSGVAFCVCVFASTDKSTQTHANPLVKGFSLSLIFFYSPLVGLVAFTLVAIAVSLKKEEEEIKSPSGCTERSGMGIKKKINKYIIDIISWMTTKK